MFVLSGLHRPWQPSRHLPPQLCLDLNTGNDAWTPNPGWSDIVEWKHHWKKILVRTIWPKISWAIQLINPTFTWLHGLYQKMFQCEPFCLVEHFKVRNFPSSICFFSRALFLQVTIFPGAQIDGRGGERCSFQAALSNLGPSLLPCFSASLHLQ